MDASILTSVGAIEQDTFEDYSNSYAELGHIVVDLPIMHNLSKRIAQLLPNNYRAVNLGCGDGSET